MSTSPYGKNSWVITVLSAIAIAALLTLLFKPDSGTSYAASGKRRAMPDFHMNTLDGGSWSLSGHRGSVVLLNFWATWCPPCRQELPGLVRLAKTYRDRGVEVAGISMDEEAELVRQFAAQHAISYPVLLPRPGEELASQVQSLPTSLLIDRQGRIARTYVGAESEAVFRHDLDMLLAEE